VSEEKRKPRNAKSTPDARRLPAAADDDWAALDEVLGAMRKYVAVRTLWDGTDRDDDTDWKAVHVIFAAIDYLRAADHE
jgi:hypothetical protein